MIAGGVYVTLTEPFEERYSYRGSDGNMYYGYDVKNLPIGVAIATTGAVMFIPGVTLKIASKGHVRRSVNTFNSLNTASNVELKFNVTGNGVSLALRF